MMCVNFISLAAFRVKNDKEGRGDTLQPEACCQTDLTTSEGLEKVTQQY